MVGNNVNSAKVSWNRVLAELGNLQMIHQTGISIGMNHNSLILFGRVWYHLGTIPILMPVIGPWYWNKV